jgi:predicted metallo-beta-lactamase superfamily hydrolase
VAVGEQVRRGIVAALKEATDIVMSHFHGDHIPLPNANPYQLKAQRIAPLCQTSRLWSMGCETLSPAMARRRAHLSEMLDKEFLNAEGQSDGPLAFSPPVPHGEPDSNLGTVMMTRIQGEDTVFVHASDIQLIDSGAVSLVLDWQPDIALVGGPPLYLSRLSSEQLDRAWWNAQRLTRHVDTLILDHHLMRCEEGLAWLDRLSSQTDHQVICAADFMEQPRRLLEARRVQLYEEMPVPDGWHEAYARGDADTPRYRDYADGRHPMREIGEAVSAVEQWRRN